MVVVVVVVAVVALVVLLGSLREDQNEWNSLYLDCSERSRLIDSVDEIRTEMADEHFGFPCAMCDPGIVVNVRRGK